MYSVCIGILLKNVHIYTHARNDWQLAIETKTVSVVA
jgi:hypothetical protein